MNKLRKEDLIFGEYMIKFVELMTCVLEDELCTHKEVMDELEKVVSVIQRKYMNASVH